MKMHGDISIRQDFDGNWRRTLHTGQAGSDGLAYDLHSPGFETRKEAEDYRFQGEKLQPKDKTNDH